MELVTSVCSYHHLYTTSRFLNYTKFFNKTSGVKGLPQFIETFFPIQNGSSFFWAFELLSSMKMDLLETTFWFGDFRCKTRGLQAVITNGHDHLADISSKESLRNFNDFSRRSRDCSRASVFCRTSRISRAGEFFKGR